MVQDVQLTPVNSIVILALEEVCRQVKQVDLGLSQDFYNSLLQQYFMDEVRIIFQESFLLNIPGQQMQGRLDDGACSSI